MEASLHYITFLNVSCLFLNLTSVYISTFVDIPIVIDSSEIYFPLFCPKY